MAVNNTETVEKPKDDEEGTFELEYEPADRADSPIIVDNEMQRNGMANNVLRINRIPLSRTAIVELLNAESPALTYVTLPNNITKQLMITKEDRERIPVNQLEPEGRAKIHIMDYCMAPHPDYPNVYCRVRVLRKEDPWILVIYIDLSNVIWVHINSLAEMEKKFLPYHPWQAIAVSLTGLDPLIGNDFDDLMPAKSFTREQILLYREVLSKFESFKTRTVLSSVVRNDYRKPIQVELFGLTGPMDEEGVSIIHLLAGYLKYRFTPHIVLNAVNEKPWTQQEYAPALPNSLQEYSGMYPWRCEFPPDWCDSDEYDDEFDPSTDCWATWSPSTVQVPPMTRKVLEDMGYIDGETLTIAVEGQRTVSPYEFFGLPLKRTRVEADPEVIEKSVLKNVEMKDTDMMIFADKLLRDKALILDQYYSMSENHHPIHKDLETFLTAEEYKNNRIYAVCAADEERAQYTGEWQRVEVIELVTPTTVNVLFIDSGGYERVLATSLYKIHKVHCTWPPMCLQLSLFGFKDANMSQYGPEREQQWSPESCENFKDYMREDVPIAVTFFNQCISERTGSRLKPGDHHYMHPDTIFVRSASVKGGEHVTEGFVNNRAAGRAMKMPDAEKEESDKRKLIWPSY